MDTITTINGLFGSLTKSEQKLAQYILNNTQEIATLSIGELSSRSNVAESTVIRFCRKIGFKGYQEFKLNLAQNLATQKAQRADLKTSEYGELVRPYFDYLIAMAPMLQTDNLAAAVELIGSANHICLLGAGLSGIVAEYLQTELIRLGKLVTFDRDIHLQTINAAVLHDGDLVIAISQSGKTKDIMNGLKVAKQHAVKVLTLTNYLNANLNLQSDVALVAPNMMGENQSFLPMIGQFILVDQLCAKLAALQPEKSQQLKAMINNALIDRL